MSKNFKKENTGYSIISNEVVRGGNLSFKAMGMYLLLASLPDSWNFSILGLAKISKDGEAVVRSALSELENEGFLTRERTRDENGKLGNCVYTLRCKPIGDSSNVKNPHGENSHVANCPQYNTNKENTKESIKEKYITPRDNISLSPLENDFERFWNSYPKKVGKPYARQVFMKKVKHNDMPSLLEGLERYKGSKQWKDSQYIPNPSTFINQERWKDEVKNTKKTWNEMNDFEKEMFLDLAKEITEDDLK